ncbi:probable tyrosyl-DNA phosphodiesterase [Neodiprion lecontei]|uniref:Probable tyrosyl-DNA phosphodiesterase n=1 Tax=Neodiprion lecontei TaxID=441921 RepID=A0A6J0C4M3_NEOLC|nr:probable tyrosyl-DNA phosphodiesterase [Neodiprion lecontei]
MNIHPGNCTSTDGKQVCPYKEKCYRRNPIHFTEMSHPHLEKLVMDQLDGTITVPPRLDFECSDRSTLLDQLKILQMVLRKERDRNDEIGTGQTSIEDKRNSIRNIPQFTNSIPQDLKDKIDRNKKIAVERREAKLREMDKRAISLSKPSTSDSSDLTMATDSKSLIKDDVSNETWSKLADRIKKQKLESRNEMTSTLGLKRNSEHFDQDSESSKRFKNHQAIENRSNKVGGQAGGASTSNGNSQLGDQEPDLMTAYAGSTTSALRNEMRLKVIEKIRSSGIKMSIVEPGEFALKYALSAPYHLFFTRVEDCKETHDQQFSLTFPEILDRSLGEIVSSLQINFMLDAGWLCAQYLLAGQSSDMLILYGEREDQEKLPPNIKTIHIKMPTFGCHHSKLMVFKYRNNGIRVVVSTANLYSDDWENRTQGVWISPHLPRLPDSANTSDGESPTGFKKDFERYLQKYNLPDLTEWVQAIRKADFSDVKVFFVASVPGNHKDAEHNAWGHRKLSTILSQHVTLPPNAPEWPIIAQCSSIGSLGPNYESWLSKEIIPAMCREKNQGLKSHPRFQFIYPSINNYKNSFDMRKGACCLPYGLTTHQKQQWLESYLYQWKASNTRRDRAIPHIKTYTRISPDQTEIPWFVLTSANLSKAAWGHKRGNHYIMSYEAGIIFVPKLVTGNTVFNIKRETPDGTPRFPIPYDVPLTRYEAQDKPFVMEFFKGYE